MLRRRRDVQPEIAERMGVATCTVRKHLEHAYRKLGVTNRLAAACVLQGRDRTRASTPTDARVAARPNVRLMANGPAGTEDYSGR